MVPLTVLQLSVVSLGAMSRAAKRAMRPSRWHPTIDNCSIALPEE